MKALFYSLITVLLLVFAGCDNGPIRSSYRPVLPELPRNRKAILGDAHWRLEWVGEAGVWQECELAPGQEMPGLSLMQEWSIPVLAWPFWPEKGLLPLMMRPAGVIFPWDTYGEKVYLSWSCGPEAFFWKELAAASASSASSSAAPASGTGRFPWYFDWPRFRELFSSGNINEDVRRDPWLADWRSIAQKTVQSGFDSRRIVPRPLAEISISGLGGRWIGSSPFAPPIDAPPDGPLNIKAADTPDTWVSSQGVLKCSTDGWVLIPRKQ